MPCPFCQENLFVQTSYPINHFNNKDFRYIRCRNCKLIYLNPFPEASDYELMYPPSYQNNEVETHILKDPFKKLPGLRFSYGYQFDLIKKQVGPNAKILDYGCGTGHFIANAIHYGFKCNGIEFNPDYVALLRANIPVAEFFTIQQFLNGNISAGYDVIRLSNVLEHLTTPLEMVKKMKILLNPGGVLLIEGPIEENFSLAMIFRKIYFRLKKVFIPRGLISSPPYHIFFSNRKNQRVFFKKCDLYETHFDISEDAWPFPSSFRNAKGIMQKAMATIAKMSVLFSRSFSKKFGNIFIYVGKLNNSD